MGRRIYTDEERKERRRETVKKYKLKNKEKIKESVKKYKLNNPEKVREVGRLYSQTENGKKSRRIKIWKRYGMICEDWKSLYEIYFHTWICEWCLFEFKNTKDRNLDHNHETGEIRGILCRECNFKDVLHN